MRKQQILDAVRSIINFMRRPGESVSRRLIAATLVEFCKEAEIEWDDEIEAVQETLCRAYCAN